MTGYLRNIVVGDGVKKNDQALAEIYAPEFQANVHKAAADLKIRRIQTKRILVAVDGSASPPQTAKERDYGTALVFRAETPFRTSCRRATRSCGEGNYYLGRRMMTLAFGVNLTFDDKENDPWQLIAHPKLCVA